MTLIESAQNSIFKKYQSLTTSKGIKKEKLFLLSGSKLVQEFLKNAKLEIECEIISPDLKPLLSQKKPVLFSQKLFQELDVLGTHFNLLAIHLPEMPTADLTKAPSGLELICPLGDPSNMGALARSALAFGVKKMILTEESSNPFLPKAIKSSSGALLQLELAKTTSLSHLPENIIALDAAGTSLHEFSWPKNCRLLVGEEGPGLQGKKFARTLKIPTNNVESLNAVVAASIALHNYRQKFQ